MKLKLTLASILALLSIFAVPASALAAGARLVGSEFHLNDSRRLVSFDAELRYDSFWSEFQVKSTGERFTNSSVDAPCHGTSLPNLYGEWVSDTAICPGLLATDGITVEGGWFVDGKRWVESVRIVLDDGNDDEVTSTIRLPHTVTAEAGDQVIATSSGDDSISSGAGDDDLSGGTGNDRLTGGAGNDTLIGDFGADAMSGGEGTDDVFYRESISGVQVTLDGLANDGTPGENDRAGSVVLSSPRASTSKAGSVVLCPETKTIDVENVWGSFHNDSITGSAQANQLVGGEGDDRLDGGCASDTLVGGIGRDTIKGGSGNDVIDVSENQVAQDPIICGPGSDTVYKDANDPLLMPDSDCETVKVATGVPFIW